MVKGGLSGAGETLVLSTEGKFWACLVGLNIALNVVMGPSMWLWWWALLRKFPCAKEHWRDEVLSALGLLVFLVVPLSLVGTTWPASAYPETRIAIAVGVGFITALPGVLSIKAIQCIATEEGGPFLGTVKDGSNAAKEYLSLRDQMRRILAVLGAMVSFSVVTTGAFRNALNAEHPGSMSAQAVLFYGILFAAGLAFLYLPVYRAVRGLGWRLVEQVCSFPQLNENAIGTTIEKREKLAAFLMLQGSAKADLQETVIVLAPLISAVISSSLGK